MAGLLALVGLRPAFTTLGAAECLIRTLRLRAFGPGLLGPGLLGPGLFGPRRGTAALLSGLLGPNRLLALNGLFALHRRTLDGLFTLNGPLHRLLPLNRLLALLRIAPLSLLHGLLP